ncbi:MAG: ABC transporter permease [Actinomycetota bacterium]
MTRRRVTTILSLGVIAAMVVWALTHDPNAVDLTNRFAGPSPSTPLGTDELGRDMLSRVVFGGFITIGAATAALVATAVIGTALGTLAAWRGGWAGSALALVTDSLVALPEIVVALIAVSILGTNLFALVIAVMAIGWLPFARLSFEIVGRLLGSDYAMAARMTGVGPVRFIGLTLLPNAARPLIAHAFLRFPGKLLLLSGLSFLGLGPQPPTSEWGAMLARGVTELERHPFLPLVPGLAIVITGYAAARIGRSLEAPIAGGGVLSPGGPPRTEPLSPGQDQDRAPAR